jgi:hypothetical protein
VECKINVFDRDDIHHLNCRIVSNTNLNNGKIISTSQMFNPKSRRIAIIFDLNPHTVFVYYFWPTGFAFFGRKDYGSDAANQLTGVAISKGKLFCVL